MTQVVLKTFALLALCLLSGRGVQAHSDHEETPPGPGRVAAPLSGERLVPRSTNRPEPHVGITTNGQHRIIVSNGLPDHEPGSFPRRGNPNAISPQRHAFRVPLMPMVADQPRPTGPAFIGMALNGVPFEPGTAEFWNRDRRSGWNYEAKSGFIDLGLDEHNAHVQPTGAYHYHALPSGLLKRLGDRGERMVQVGWAADGFPIYSGWGHADPQDAASPLRQVR